MDYIQKIRTLYNLSGNDGYSENEIIEAENKLNIKLPKVLREYYAILGKNEVLNKTHNVLYELNEIDPSNDEEYLIFYEDNQGACIWGINKNDLENDNPEVYRKDSLEDKAEEEWVLHSKTMEGFLLSISYVNGVMQGLDFCGIYDGGVEDKIMDRIENAYTEIKNLETYQTRYFTNGPEIIMTDGYIWIGTNNKESYKNMLEKINVSWDYRDELDGYD
jgi:hypothetical protein